MKFYLSLLTALVLLLSCKNTTRTEIENNQGIHQVTVQEILHAKEYSYIRVLEVGVEKWIAAPSIQVEIGKTYYFKDGLEMPNFESKELNRTFETIYFVDGISTDQEMKTHDTLYNPQYNTDLSQQAARPILEKQKVDIKPPEDGITVAELYKNMKSYEGKRIKIKGKITKYNPAILKKIGFIFKMVPNIMVDSI